MNETSIRIQVEMFGLSRIIAGEKEINLSLGENATFRDVVQLLAHRYPDMIGDVIQTDGETMQSPNILNVNGQRMIHSHQLDEHVSDGDTLVLMSVSAGG